MEKIKSFDDLIRHLSSGSARRRVAVVWASDDHTQEAISMALKGGFMHAICVGARKEIEESTYLKPYMEHIEIVDADDKDAAAAKAVALVREGHAEVLMKGLINTDNLLHAVLNKETGILPKGRVLTHIAAADVPTYPKLLFFTDAAVIPYPTQEQRVEQVRYVSELCHSFGIEEPRSSIVQRNPMRNSSRSL